MAMRSFTLTDPTYNTHPTFRSKVRGIGPLLLFVTVLAPTIPYVRSMVAAHSLDEMRGAKAERAEAYKRYVGVKRQRRRRSRLRRLLQTKGEQLLLFFITLTILLTKPQAMSFYSKKSKPKSQTLLTHKKALPNLALSKDQVQKLKIKTPNLSLNST